VQIARESLTEVELQEIGEVFERAVHHRGRYCEECQAQHTEHETALISAHEHARIATRCERSV
jgi:hypothetical protein